MQLAGLQHAFFFLDEGIASEGVLDGHCKASWGEKKRLDPRSLVAKS